jgi:hypothetical protein
MRGREAHTGCHDPREPSEPGSNTTQAAYLPLLRFGFCFLASFFDSAWR